MTVAPFRAFSGETGGAVAVVDDITERVRGVESQRFLAEAGRVLAGSLDQSEIATGAVRLAVPWLADWCTLEVFGSGGRLRRLAVAHADAGRERLLRGLRPGFAFGVGVAADPAVVTLIREIDDALVGRVAGSRREHSLLCRLAPRSAVVAPLTARGRALGMMLLVRSAGRDPCDELEAATVEAFARQAAVAIANASLYAASREAQLVAEEAAGRTRRLQCATAALSEAVTPLQVAEVLVGQGVAAVGADAGFVRLLSQDRAWLELAASVGFAEAFVRGHGRLSIESGFPGADVANDGKARWFESSAAIEAAYPEFAAVAARQGALAMVPLRFASGPRGVIALAFEEERPFAHEERELLAALATLCAQALERAELFEAEQEARSRAESVSERIGHLQAITAGLNLAKAPSEVADVIIDQALAALGAAAGAIALISNDGRTFTTLRAVDTNGEPVAVWRRFPADLRLPLTEAVRTGKPILVETLAERYRRFPDILTVSRFSADGALVVLPLRVEGRVFGGLGLSFAEERGFDEEELEFLMTVAEKCAQALERARLYEDELEAHRIAEEAREQYRFLLGALDAERRSLGQLVERLHEGVIAVRRDGTIAFSNTRAAEFLEGLSEKSPLPKEWLGFPLRAFALALFDTTARREAPVGDVTNGDFYSLTGLPAGEAETALLVINDLSERERREQAAREFVANAAHELRTPVASIAVAVEALQAGAKEEPERRDEFLGHIERESARLARLARSLLVLARTQAGAEPPPCTKLRLRPLLAEILAGVGRKDGVDIVLSCPPRLEVTSNRELLEHAILNLAVNALRHTGSGTVRMVASAGPAGGAVIEVRDSGPGIPPEQQERVFERFYRVATDRSDGFGLGLAITRQAVEVLGGRVVLESTPQVGTTVRLELPAEPGGAGG